MIVTLEYLIVGDLLFFTFGVVFCLFFLLLSRGNSRKIWATIIVFACVFSMLISLVSIWNVWTPYITNMSVQDGDFAGTFPWSKLSYPLYLSVYHTPFAQRAINERNIASGNVSFSLFVLNAQIGKIDGEFFYHLAFGAATLFYSINFPILNDAESFVLFLFILFTFFNLTGIIIAMALRYFVMKILNANSTNCKSSSYFYCPTAKTKQEHSCSTQKATTSLFLNLFLCFIFSRSFYIA